MNVKHIIEVCLTRYYNELGCRRCKYCGKTCNHAKTILRVERPSEYITNNVEYKEEKDNERFNKENK